MQFAREKKLKMKIITALLTIIYVAPYCEIDSVVTDNGVSFSCVGTVIL